MIRSVAMMRNFYGVVTVYGCDADKPLQSHDFAFFSGNIMHGGGGGGRQFVDPSKPPARLHLLHAGDPQSVARSIISTKTGQPASRHRRDLGIGTLATYARPGDHFVLYEINLDVVTLAKKYFSYLSENDSQIDGIVLGDARISLDRQEPKDFDLLVLDAFSGDAIPVHLLTAEAFQIYDRHLSVDGATMVFNVTNTYLDAAPVVAGLAGKYGFQAVRLQTPGDYDHNICRTDWMVLSLDAALVEALKAAPENVLVSDREIVWTDAYSNLFEILQMTHGLRRGTGSRRRSAGRVECDGGGGGVGGGGGWGGEVGGGGPVHAGRNSYSSGGGMVFPATLRPAEFPWFNRPLVPATARSASCCVRYAIATTGSISAANWRR